MGARGGPSADAHSFWRRTKNAVTIMGLTRCLRRLTPCANIIAETVRHSAGHDQTRESHAINDLGIDSLDFLDIAFAIDKAFGIKMPLEQWTQEVNDGKATTEQYFVLEEPLRPHRRTRRCQEA